MQSILAVTGVRPGLQLEGVRNFRAVAPSLPGLYRSAGLENATDWDAALILDSARIRCVLDLRSDDEIERARRGASRAGRSLLAAFERGARVGAGCVASEGNGRLRRVHVSLFGDLEAFFAVVEGRMPAQSKARAFLTRGFSGKAYDQLIYEELASGGHELLYTAMLQASSYGMVRVWLGRASNL